METLDAEFEVEADSLYGFLEATWRADNDLVTLSFVERNGYPTSGARVERYASTGELLGRLDYWGEPVAVAAFGNDILVVHQGWRWREEFLTFEWIREDEW